jgi:cell division protease FtsH
LYLPLLVLLLWSWQAMFSRAAYTTIPYSEFKERLRRGEITEALVKPDTIEGRMRLLPSGTGTNGIPSKTETDAEKTTGKMAETQLFRTIRVEDPDLAEELEAAKVRFRGERSPLLLQFMLTWIIPLVLLIFLWSFLSRRISG